MNVTHPKLIFHNTGPLGQEVTVRQDTGGVMCTRSWVSTLVRTLFQDEFSSCWEYQVLSQAVCRTEKTGSTFSFAQA